MMMNRRTLSTLLAAGAAASLVSTRGMAAHLAPGRIEGPAAAAEAQPVLAK
jgi:hypothetical protein